MNQLGNTGSERGDRARERQVEKDEDGIVFDRDALMDKQRLAERAQELREQEEAIAETASDKTRGCLGKTWTDTPGEAQNI